MAPTLAATVHVTDPATNERHVFVAGDVLPEWAVDLVTNPAAFASEQSNDASPAAASPDDALREQLEAMTRDELYDLAKQHDLDVDSRTKKDELVDALLAAYE
jgi:hypothetical protein